MGHHDDLGVTATATDATDVTDEAVPVEVPVEVPVRIEQLEAARTAYRAALAAYTKTPPARRAAAWARLLAAREAANATAATPVAPEPEVEAEVEPEGREG